MYLRTIYNDKQSTLEESLNKNESATIHKQSLCFLANKNFNVIKGIPPSIANELFDLNGGVNCDSRNGSINSV